MRWRLSLGTYGSPTRTAGPCRPDPVSVTTMSTETVTRASEGRGVRLPGVTPRHGARLRVVAVIAAAFVVTEGVAQAVTPFIRQDDWAFLLPEGSPGAVPPSYYNVSEGRWLNSG